MKQKCNNTVKHTCPETGYATCIAYETILPEFSELEGCVSIEDTTTELYTLVGDIKDETDLSALGELCLSYTMVEGKLIVKNALLKFEEKICELETQIENLQNLNICNVSISECGLDFNGLVTECGETPQTLIEVLQLLLNQHITP